MDTHECPREGCDAEFYSRIGLEMHMIHRCEGERPHPWSPVDE